MPSPFPGMNPYLEQDDVWHDFHGKFLPALAEQLVQQVRPHYIVKLDEHVYVHELPDEARRLAGRADVAVGLSPTHAGIGPATGILDAPAQVTLPAPDVERLVYLEVRDRHSRELIAVVELLSPSNKRSVPDREQYLGKRASLLGSQAHLVEIDLLRGGRPMPADNRPGCAYSVLVSRIDERPTAGLWPIALRDRLPLVPVPLRPPHGEARLDLQHALHRVYDASGYEDYIYGGAPDPPLATDDAEWARQLIPRSA